MSRRYPRVEWDLKGWRVDENAPGASFGISLGVKRDPKSTIRMGAIKPPHAAATFGWLHTMTSDGTDNIICMPRYDQYVGLSDPAAAREAVAAYHDQQRGKR